MNARISCSAGPNIGSFQEVEVAEVFVHDGHTYFMHLSPSMGWKMSEWTSGFCVYSDSLCGLDDEDAMPMEDVKDFGIDLLNKVGTEKVNAAIEKAIREYGAANLEVPHA